MHPHTQPPHAEDIKAAIRKRGETLTSLALKNKLGASAIRVALIRPNPCADRVVSKFLGVPLHELWPDRYDESGGRIRHVRFKTSEEPKRAHRLSKQAA